MALVQLGDRLADWDTKQLLVYPWVDGRKDRGYLFFLDQATPRQETRNQYLAVLAEIETSFGTYQTPLEAKYFPGLTPMFFSVAVPDADWDRDIRIRIVLLPKEFKAGAATVKNLEIELAYDDDALRDISFPVG